MVVGNTAEGGDYIVVKSQRPDSLFKGTMSENAQCFFCFSGGLIKGFDPFTVFMQHLDPLYNQNDLEISLSTMCAL